MSDYPALKSMGIQNPQEIARFEMFTVNQTDILRVIYDRKSGSILPVSRRYKFPQLKKSVLVDSGSRRTEVMYESSPEFRNALAELESITRKIKSTSENKDALLEELRLLEAEVTSRISYVRKLVGE
ncbi:MAG: DUF3461 family protein [Pseudomonadota bacterium]